MAAEQEEAAEQECEEAEDGEDAAALLEADPEAEPELDGDGEDDDDEEDDEEDDKAENAEGSEEEQADDDAGEAPAEGNEEVKKRRGKPKDDDAPKKPPNPYQQHAATARLELIEKRPELKSDLKAMGKALAECWAQVLQEKKDAMQKEYERRKAIYDVELAKYKATDKYKVFQKVFNDWKDGREMKKLLKRQKKDAPEKPKSGYMTFNAKARSDIQAEGKPFSMSELGKEIAARWAALGTAKQDEYNDAAKKAKAEWDVAMMKYRRSEQFRKAVDEQAALEVKQGLRKLKLENEGKAPSKPPAPFQLYSAASGVKGSFAQLVAKFKELEKAEQEKFQQQAEKLKETFKAESAKFWASPEGVKITRVQTALKQRIAVRTARRKFLVDAPARPPSTAALFAASGSSGKFKELSDAERQKWEAEHDRLTAEYSEKLEKFKSSPAYKTFEEAVQKAQGKGKAGAKAKAKPKAKATAKPEGMPEKAPSAYKLFQKEQSGKITGGLPAFSKAWTELGTEGQKVFVERAAAGEAKYKEAMLAWQKSDAGKKHERALTKDKQKKKEEKARAKYLNGADAPKPPEKPKSAVKLFEDSKRSELMQQNEKLGSREASRKAAELWAALDADGRKTWEEQAKTLAAAYEEQMIKYKATPAYKKYERMAGKAKPVKSGGKGGGKKRKVAPGQSGAPAEKKKQKGDDLEDFMLDSDSDIMGSDLSTDVDDE